MITCRHCGKDFSHHTRIGRQPKACKPCAHIKRLDRCKAVQRRYHAKRRAARARALAATARICTCVGNCGRSLDGFPRGQRLHPLCKAEHKRGSMRERARAIVAADVEARTVRDLTPEEIDATFTAARAYIRSVPRPRDGWDGYQVSFE